MTDNETRAVEAADKESEKLKNDANELFKNGKFPQSVEVYSRALELNPSQPTLRATLLSNRAFAHCKLEAFGLAVQDSKEAIQADAKYAKGYYRLGSALFALGKHKEALNNFRTVARMNPTSKEARDKLAECEKIVRKLQFEEAIRAGEPVVSAFAALNLDDFGVVDASYDGPRLAGDGSVTRQFVIDLLAHLKAQKKLHVRYVVAILQQAHALLRAAPSLVTINVPTGAHFTVCGDVHGQYYDLLNIWDINGMPAQHNPYLFNGDFVDRGSFSVEVILALLAWKVLLPNHFFLQRGNHESITMNRMYGFEGEVVHKYSTKVFELFTELFTALPLAAVIAGELAPLDKRVLVVHGGLFSRDDVTIDQLTAIDRFRQPPDEGLMCELLWSDPQPFAGRSPNKRGVGVAFGPDVTKRFLEYNKLGMVVRSHEVKEEGYLVEADGLLCTVFSAPNYCDSVGNKGAFIRFDDKLQPKYTSFTAVPHPPVRPMQFAGGFGSLFGL